MRLPVFSKIMSKGKAFSCFVKNDIDLDTLFTVLTTRITNEINELSLVILAFEVGFDEKRIEYIKDQTIAIFRRLTDKNCQIGVVKNMTQTEYIARQALHGIPTYEVFALMKETSH